MSDPRGFTAVPNRIMRDRTLTHTARFLYAILLGYAFGDGRCTASAETLAADIGVGRTALFDAIRLLKERELVEVAKERHDGGWHNVYTPRVTLHGVVVEDEQDAPVGVVRNPDDPPANASTMRVVRNPDDPGVVRQADGGSSARRTVKKNQQPKNNPPRPPQGGATSRRRSHSRGSSPHPTEDLDVVDAFPDVDPGLVTEATRRVRNAGDEPTAERVRLALERLGWLEGPAPAAT